MYGFAKYMRDALPHATYLGFTVTPIESTDKNTAAVFGDYIDVYDIERAVADGATVEMHYESRIGRSHYAFGSRNAISVICSPLFQVWTGESNSTRRMRIG